MSTVLAGLNVLLKTRNLGSLRGFAVQSPLSSVNLFGLRAASACIKMSCA